MSAIARQSVPLGNCGPIRFRGGRLRLERAQGQLRRHMTLLCRLPVEAFSLLIVRHDPPTLPQTDSEVVLSIRMPIGRRLAKKLRGLDLLRVPGGLLEQ